MTEKRREDLDLSSWKWCNRRDPLQSSGLWSAQTTCTRRYLHRKVKNIAANIGAAFIEIAPGKECYYDLSQAPQAIFTHKIGKKRFVSETSWSFRSAGKQSRQKRRLSAAISILPGGMQYWQPEIPGSVLPGSFPVLFGIRTKKNWVISKMRTTGWSFVRMQRTFPLKRYLRRFRNWRMPVSS